MGLEIERKFLVKSKVRKIYNKLCEGHTLIKQGYLNTDIDKTVRVRVVGISNGHQGGMAAFITVKGRNEGCTRKEFEYKIPALDGEEMLGMCDDVIAKMRYNVPLEDLRIEVDAFEDKNQGLVVAEIEFKEDDERQLWSEEKLKEILPDWIGEEVTGKPEYYNSSLIERPYCEW